MTVCWLVCVTSLPTQAGTESACAQRGILSLTDGSALNTRLAVDGLEKFQGLTGVTIEEFSIHDAMLFLYRRNGERAVWSPGTAFDLDVFYLDEQLTVRAIQRGINELSHIEFELSGIAPKTFYARHFIEMRSDSRYAKKITEGMQLVWISEPSLGEILACRHTKLTEN